MLMPSIFGENLLDDFMDFPFEGFRNNTLMKTDVRDLDGSYELDIDMPGFKKEDIKAELKDGYLTVNASANHDQNEKDKDGRYIRRERYSGTCSRTFYVGDVTEQDIKARFEDGILKLSVPKKEAQPDIEDKKFISIE